MSQVIEILTSLGINNTLFYQFAIFFVAYIGMDFIVFKPYLNAYKERQRRTVGGQQEAQDLILEAEKQEARYKEEAKKLHIQIKEVFSEKNKIAKKEVEAVMNEAKVELDTEILASRKELENTIATVRKEMDNHIPEISKNIENKFLRH